MCTQQSYSSSANAQTHEPAGKAPDVQVTLPPANSLRWAFDLEILFISSEKNNEFSDAEIIAKALEGHRDYLLNELEELLGEFNPTEWKGDSDLIEKVRACNTHLSCIAGFGLGKLRQIGALTFPQEENATDETSKPQNSTNHVHI